MLIPGRIVVVGSHAPGFFIRVNRIPNAGETVIGWDYQEPVDGGKGSNQAIAAARLGAPVSFIGSLGRDRIGETGEAWMREAGVDTQWLLHSEHISSGMGLIMLDHNGVPAMVTCMGANAQLSNQDVERALNSIEGVSVLLTQFEINPEVALHAARIIKNRGMITIVNPAPAVETLTGLDAATILTPNETEAKTLLGLNQDEKVDLRFLSRNLREKSRLDCVIVTGGEKGIAGSDSSGEWKIDAPAVRVVDTSGAGDVFCAALAVGLLQGKSVRSASRDACAIATLSVTRPGTIPAFPTAPEAEQFLAGCNTRIYE